MGKFTPIIMAIAVAGFCVSTAFADFGDSLKAYYPFNGDANDESGNGVHGTVHGAVLTIDREGKSNSAYHFDGMDDYIEIKDRASSGKKLVKIIKLTQTERMNSDSDLR